MKRFLLLTCIALLLSTGEASPFRGGGEKKLGFRRQAKPTKGGGKTSESKKVPPPAGGQASMMAMVFNLVNNVAGAHKHYEIGDDSIALWVMGDGSLERSANITTHVYCRCRHSFLIRRTGEGYRLDPLYFNFGGSWIDIWAYFCHGR